MNKIKSVADIKMIFDKGWNDKNYLLGIVNKVKKINKEKLFIEYNLIQLSEKGNFVDIII